MNTPDTTAYLLLGLAFIAVVMVVMIATIVAGLRSLRDDVRVIEQLGEDER